MIATSSEALKEVSLSPRQAQAMHTHQPLVGGGGRTAQVQVQKHLERFGPRTCMVISRPRGGQSQPVTAGLASLQVAAYGGKLRYTLSYTAGAQGSSLSDPDVQIMVSTWISCWAGRWGSKGSPALFLLPFQPIAQLAWHQLGELGLCPHLFT